MAEPLTLYKLMILYLLKKVNYPLSNGQMSEFFVSKSYTDYFTFQMVINELLGTSLIHKETIRNKVKVNNYVKMIILIAFIIGVILVFVSSSRLDLKSFGF